MVFWRVDPDTIGGIIPELEREVARLNKELDSVVRDTHWLRIAQELEKENEGLREEVAFLRELDSAMEEMS